MKSFWLSVGLLASGLAHAQDYLVTTRKDTLRGKLSISGYNTSDRLVLTSASICASRAPRSRLPRT